MPDVKAVSVADVSQNFEEQLKAFMKASETNAEALQNGDQPKWMFPQLNGWNGDTNDYDGMSEPFSRKQSNDECVKSMSDASKPGTSGDVVVTTLQVDYLSVMERAFRTRHAMPMHRAVAHSVGRMKGHGNDNGPVSVLVLEYLRRLVKESKGLQE